VFCQLRGAEPEAFVVSGFSYPKPSRVPTLEGIDREAKPHDAPISAVGFFPPEEKPAGEQNIRYEAEPASAGEADS